MKIEPLDISRLPLHRNTPASNIRDELVKLNISAGVVLSFTEAKKNFGGYIYRVIRPLSPKKFSWRSMDNEKKKFGVWRIR